MSKRISFIIVIMAMHFTGALGYAQRYQGVETYPTTGKILPYPDERSQNIEVPFSIAEIIEKVSNHSNREGNRILTKNRTEEIIHGSRTSEFLIDTNVVFGPDTMWQWAPSVVFDGTNYLVVWMDKREESLWDIYGARVDQSGEILDKNGIIISNAVGDQAYPSIAFDGTNYLVVWQDDRDIPSTYYIYGARVSPSGTVLDPAGIAISTAAYQEYPSVAFGNTDYLVVWKDTRSGFDIYGARVSPSGTVLDPAGIAISTATDDQESPSIAFDGTNYLVVWQDIRSGSNWDIYGTRVSPSGTVLDPSGIAISITVTEQLEPSVAFDGTNYLVVWQDFDLPSNDIYGARVSPSGTVLDPAGIAISTATDAQASPSIAFDGTNYLVVWQDFRSGSEWDIYSARVSPSGTVLDPSGIAISTATDYQAASSIAFGNANYLVVWQDGRNNFRDDIYGARVTPSCTVLDPTGIIISTAVYAYEQRFPSIAFDGTNHLIVWQDYRSFSEFDIYGARVTSSGIVLDPAGITISTATDAQASPSVTFDGTNYLIVWQDYRSGSEWDIYGARVTPAGTVLDPSGIAISTAANDQVYPSVTFDGTNYLVVWLHGGFGFPWDIYGTRVTPAGTVLDPAGIAISTATGSQWYPSVAFDGTNYLVVWQDFRSGSTYDIYSTRVTPAGTVLDPTGIVISTAIGSQWFPSVVFDGTNYFVVWQDFRSDSTYDIYGARVTPAGTVLDPSGIAISTAINDQRWPSLAFNDTNYLVMWQDYRSDSTYDIYGTRVTPAGTILDPAGIAFSTQSGNQISSAMVHGTGAEILITYSGFTDSINGNPVTPAMRIWGVFASDVIGIEEISSIPSFPKAPKILHVYPNPALTRFAIRFIASHRGNAKLKIFDILGRNINTLWQGTIRPGINVIDGLYVEEEAKGVYFLMLESEKTTVSTKLILE